MFQKCNIDVSLYGKLFIFFVPILVLLAFACSNQNTATEQYFGVDYDEVEIIVKDKNSPFYYKKLYDRLMKEDRSLTEEDFYYLYYGNVFQEQVDMSGLAENYKLMDSLLRLAQGEINDHLLIYMSEVFEEIKADKNVCLIKYLILSQFNLDFSRNGENIQSDQYADFVYFELMKVVQATGNSKTPDLPIYLTGVYDFVALANLCNYTSFSFGQCGNYLVNYIIDPDSPSDTIQRYFRSYYSINAPYPELTHARGVDYKAVKEAIFDPTSPFFHEDLIKKYQTSYEDLSMEDYYYLYYGYLFRKGYKPVPENPYIPEINMILDKNHYSDNDLKRALHLTDKFLMQAPLNITCLYLKRMLSYRLYGENDPRTIEADSKEQNVKWMVTRNDAGSTKDNPIYLLYHDDETVLTYLRKYKVVDEDFDESIQLKHYELEGDNMWGDKHFYFKRLYPIPNYDQ